MAHASTTLAQRGFFHREAVVLGGDLDPSGRQILDRMVAPVMAKGELVGSSPQGQRQQLMPEADAPNRQLTEQGTNVLDWPRHMPQDRRGHWTERSRRACSLAARRAGCLPGRHERSVRARPCGEICSA